MSKDFLEDIDANIPARRNTGRNRVTDPVQSRLKQKNVKTAVASDETKVPKSMRAGDYIRQTITILPEQKKLIKKLAKENQVSLLAFYRWLLDQGLQVYEEGERPLPSEPVYSDVAMGHWSSKGGGDASS